MERIARDSPSRCIDLRFVGIVAIAIAIVWSTWILTDTYRSI